MKVFVQSAALFDAAGPAQISTPEAP